MNQPKPKVTLVSWTSNPLETIHAMTRNMFGERITDLSLVDLDDAIDTIREIKKTSIQGPLEFVDLTFQVENVPRALTHQLVRTRVGAVYSQESLRFATKKGGFNYDIGPSVNTSDKRAEYDLIMAHIQDSYQRLVAMGVETQDARGVLPINVLTNIGVKYNLKTLIGVAEVRLCYQSQPHWMSVITQMKQEVHDKIHPELASLLQPYCAKHGKCGFQSEYDRKCPRQTIKRPSSKEGKNMKLTDFQIQSVSGEYKESAGIGPQII